MKIEILDSLRSTISSIEKSIQDETIDADWKELTGLQFILEDYYNYIYR